MGLTAPEGDGGLAARADTKAVRGQSAGVFAVVARHLAQCRCGFAVTVDWVYCFLSRHEGGQRERWRTGGGQSPKIIQNQVLWAFQSLKNFGGAGSSADVGPGSRICFGSRDRVSLKSCSGAILDRWVWVVPGVSVV